MINENIMSKINKQKNRLKISIDLDSTIIDTSKTIINLHNKLYPNKKIDYINNHDWKFKPMIKTEQDLKDLFKLFDSPQFYKDVVINDNAIDIIKELSNYYEVTILTKHCETRKLLTFKWIYKIFKDNIKLVFVDSFEEKGNYPTDIIIDDRIDCLDSFKNSNIIKLCYGNYQWNKEWNGIRVLNWNEIKNILL